MPGKEIEVFKAQKSVAATEQAPSTKSVPLLACISCPIGLMVADNRPGARSCVVALRRLSFGVSVKLG